MALRQGDLEHAHSVFAEGRALFESAHLEGGMALCTAGLSWIAHVCGPFEDAVPFARDAVALARASGEEWIIADALNNLGVALRSERDLAGSQRALEESLGLRRKIGDLEGVTAGLSGLALVALAEDDFGRAEVLFREAFEISDKRGDVFYDAARDVVFAYLAFGRREYDVATTRCVRALISSTEHGFQQFTAYALETLAGVAAVEGRLWQAARLLGAAVAISDRIRGGAHTGERLSRVEYDWEARAVTRALERARSAVGAQAWDAAVANGRSLRLDEALAYAAEWTVEVVSDPPVTTFGLRDIEA
jgi:tetratricopeptide (TPR) repeat protein